MTGVAIRANADVAMTVVAVNVVVAVAVVDVAVEDVAVDVVTLAPVAAGEYDHSRRIITATHHHR